MGLFGKKETCCVCEKNDGVHKIFDGFVCKDCEKSAEGYFKNPTWRSKMAKQQYIEAISASKENAKKFIDFSITKKVGDYIKIDEAHREFELPGSAGTKSNPKIFNYSDLAAFELVADETTIKKSGLGSAVAGGILFGGVGAVVGGLAGKKSLDAISSLKIRVTTTDPIFTTAIITLLSSEAKKGSFMYKITSEAAQNVISALEFIDASKSNAPVLEALPELPIAEPNVSRPNPLDEIKQLADLHAQGILTDEEFAAKKKQLLGI